MNIYKKSLALSLPLLLAVISCTAVGCSNKQESDAATATGASKGAAAVATPPPGFDVQKAQAAQQASQKASEDFRKYLEKKK